jgi:hypothetical protein
MSMRMAKAGVHARTPSLSIRIMRFPVPPLDGSAGGGCAGLVHDLDVDAVQHAAADDDIESVARRFVLVEPGLIVGVHGVAGDDRPMVRDEFPEGHRPGR